MYSLTGFSAPHVSVNLLISVYRSLFDEEEDMMIATYLFQSTGGKEPVKLQIHHDDDVQRMMKEYESRPMSSSVSVKLPQPLVTPMKRPATANAAVRAQSKPETVVFPETAVLPDKAFFPDKAASPKSIVVEEYKAPPRRPITSGSFRGKNK